MEKPVAFTAVVLGSITEYLLWNSMVAIWNYQETSYYYGYCGSANTSVLSTFPPIFILLIMVLIAYPIFWGILELIPGKWFPKSWQKLEERCPHCGKKIH